MSEPVGLIVGSGASELGLDVEARSGSKTPFGEPSSALLRSRLGDCELLWIARHGESGRIAPHLVNYRANVWALHQHGVRRCLAVNAVGIIVEGEFVPGGLAVPDQLIDYTWGREQSFDGPGERVGHIEFTEPFDAELRDRLVAAAAADGTPVARGVYGVTQGPRLETAAEIERMARDGCTMVGMTAMPEAALAKAIGLRYAVLAVGVNRAAGRGGAGIGIHAELERNLGTGMARARRTLVRALAER
ncbi:MAG TPA: S-methyl-5'-thioinosine phosphorylase [Gammaproteobacteria bacterium]|nr:S-methyl-5'-thioinosine phosphorylase [Gammaproteobacteria bacterium]